MDSRYGGGSGPLAVVGGATSGLGRATTDTLAARGFRLLLWSRSVQRLEETVTQVRQQFGVAVSAVSADAEDPGAAAAVADAAIRLGGASVLVLNSGGPPPVDPTDTTPDGWRSALQMLAITPIELATRLLPSMREGQFGRILAVLSSGVVQPISSLVYSNAGRAALMGWLKTVASVVAIDGVTVNAIMPGRIATPRVDELDRAAADREGRPLEAVRSDSFATIPAGRYGDPTEFASLVGFLASTEASYITGHLHAVDGGMIRGW